LLDGSIRQAFCFFVVVVNHHPLCCGGDLLRLYLQALTSSAPYSLLYYLLQHETKNAAQLLHLRFRQL
jgi:hypothetical protein